MTNNSGVLRFVILLVALIFCGPAVLRAESKKDLLPVYVVDMQKVLEESATGRAAKDSLEKELKDKRIEIESIKADALGLKEEIQKQAAVLSSSAMRAKQEKLGSKQKELQEAFEDFRDEFKVKNNTLIGKIVKEIDQVVKELAAEKGYPFVIEKNERMILYYDSRIDVSNEVIKILDKRKLSY